MRAPARRTRQTQPIPKAPPIRRGLFVFMRLRAICQRGSPLENNDGKSIASVWFRRAGGHALASKARVVVYFEVQPRQTLSWRVAHDSELRVHRAAVWLTRHSDPYDY